MLTLSYANTSTQPPPSHKEATQQWRTVLAACDELTRQGHCGPDLLRLASELDAPFTTLLERLQRQCESVRHYCLEQSCESMREAQQLYQHLYVDAYVAVDRTQQQSVVNDGETRHGVSLDPEGPFNRIQCEGSCRLTLPSDNETLYKYNVYSTLGTVINVRQKVDALWQHYDTAIDVMMEQKLPQPLDSLRECVQSYNDVERRLDLVQQSLYRVYSEKQHSDVLALYGQCVALLKVVKALLQQARQQTTHTAEWRDNVLVRLGESASLLQRATRPYEQTQAHRVEASQVRSKFSIF